jgi:hypothetical protein
MSVRRVVASLVALLVSLLVILQPVAAAGTPVHAPAPYAYDSHHSTTVQAYTSTERGPPSACDHVNARTAVDHRSYGALTRPSGSTRLAIATYHYAALHARVAGATATTTKGPQGPDGHSAGLDRAGVAANSADGLARLPAPQQRSIRSLQSQIEKHQTKLADYRANPDAYDNLGILERAPTPEIRQRIIDGRIRHLETEIRTFQDQIDKLLGGG